MLRHLPRLTDRALARTLALRGYRRTYLPTSVGRVHVLRARGEGSLPPVLVLHGLSSAGAHYEPLLSRLRRHCRAVFALDMPGHGSSDTPPDGLCHRGLEQGLREALDLLVEATGPLAIFGNSLGGAAAIKYASQRPENVRSLILAAPGGAPVGSEEAFARFRQRLKMRRHRDALDFVDRLFARPPAWRHAMALAIRSQFSRPGVQQLIASIRHRDSLAPEDLRALTMPTLVLWGGADRVFQPGASEFFEQHLPPSATLVHLADYGHVPHMSHLEDLTARTVGHLATLAAPEIGLPAAASDPSLDPAPARLLRLQGPG